jgi:hypothetical protein
MYNTKLMNKIIARNVMLVMMIERFSGDTDYAMDRDWRT